MNTDKSLNTQDFTDCYFLFIVYKKKIERMLAKKKKSWSSRTKTKIFFIMNVIVFSYIVIVIVNYIL